MTEETTYREGDDEVTPIGKAAASPELPPVGSEPEPEGGPEGGEQLPAETAVLLIMRPGGTIEAVASLPGIEMQRAATLRDVRDMCHSMYSDIQNTMAANVAAKVTARELMATFSQLGKPQDKNRIVTPGRG